MSLRRPTVACWLFTYFISPLCGVAETPDCGMLVIYFISPLCGVAQTPDWGISLCLLTFRGVASDTRSVHFIINMLLHIHKWPACMHQSFYYLLWLTSWAKNISEHRCYIIPVFLMFVSTFKVLTGLSLAIVLVRFLARRGATVMTAPEPKQRW